MEGGIMDDATTCQKCSGKVRFDKNSFTDLDNGTFTLHGECPKCNTNVIIYMMPFKLEYTEWKSKDLKLTL